MRFIDTHTHLFATQFDEDREAVVKQAIDQGVEKLFLPNINVDTLQPMLALYEQFPKHCYPMAGLHPCDVKEDYKGKLTLIRKWIELNESNCFGIGETGLDYYWDKSFITEQKSSLVIQADWAKELKLPIILHTRDSFEDNISIVEEQQDGRLKGIFHCFTGTVDEAKRVIDAGFLLGIGGVCTFKNSGQGLRETLKEIDLKHLVLETDSPYLAPHPNRGKRNESSYLPLIAQTIADVKGLTIADIANTTTSNAIGLFDL